MPVFNRSSWTVARAAARGLTAAMAMTGTRTVTANTGLLEQSPPEAIVEERATRWVRDLDPHRRAALTELVHWSYGAVGGAAFGVLPGWVRAHPVTGPAYGLGIWLAFELGIAPLLGLQHVKQQRILSRAVVATDHALYGIVVAGRLAPEPEVITRERRRHRRTTL